MKRFKYLLVTCTLLLLLAGCSKRNFFPDEDDPGLSRFTSKGYNIATSYINDKSYINPFRNILRGNSLPFLTRMVTNSSFDTFSLSWQIQPEDSSMIIRLIKAFLY